MQRLPIPPFSRDTAMAKVQAAEDAWNTRDPEIVAQENSPDCVWRNREEFFEGRAAIKFLLKRKWAIALHCKMMKEVWAYTDNRISVSFKYEWQHAETGQWYRTHGNEHWEFDPDGYMKRRDMSANDIPIVTSERRIGL